MQGTKARCLATVFTTALLAAAGTAAQAGEVYTSVGFPGVGLGYAQPLNTSFTVRGDFMSLGKRSKKQNEDGIDYIGSYELNRAAALVDWFPFSGRFRFTGGATFNKYNLELDASGAGGTLTIGDRTYVTTANDGLNVQIKFPKTTPYAGIGWGHQTAEGFRFSADIGAAIGRAKLTAKARGQLANQPDIQKNIDQELADLRDGVGRVRAIPQLSLSFGWSF